MPPADFYEERSGTSSVDTLLLPTPWTAHTAFSLQARVALQRSYAAGVDPAYIASLARRQEALRRWRGLAPGSGLS